MNDEFEIPNGSYSVSNIQDYIKSIIKKHEELSNNSSIHIYINRINNRLVFKMKDGYNLELQTPETMRLFGNTKKIIDKTKNRENVQSLEELEIVLVEFNLIDDQYQQNSEVLYTIGVISKVLYLCVNFEPSNLVFLKKTYNT